MYINVFKNKLIKYNMVISNAAKTTSTINIMVLLLHTFYTSVDGRFRNNETCEVFQMLEI